MKKKLLCVILTLLMVFMLIPAAAPTQTYAATNDKGIKEFVTRLYEVCLNRKPDKAGLNDWVNKLKNGMTGAEVAHGFVFSKEFKKKNLTDSEFVTYMYKAFFDRKPDSEGKKYWVNKLKQGATKGEVFDGFTHSAEFKKLCKKYGITPGDQKYAKEDFRVFNETKAKEFVKRLYRVCLGRGADKNGLKHWVDLLRSGKSGTYVAHGFVFSKEFRNMNLCNDHFLDYMYEAFFDRSPDEAGKESWMTKLRSGATKGQVFDGFTNSAEFKKLCKKYGIIKGNERYGSSNFKPADDCVFGHPNINPGTLGSAGQLAGKTVILSIFANESTYSWDWNNQADVDRYWECLDNIGYAVDYLTECAASYGRKAEFIYDWRYDSELSWTGTFNEMLVRFDGGGYWTEANWINDWFPADEIKKKYDADSVIYMFFFNTPSNNEIRSWMVGFNGGEAYTTEIVNIFVGYGGGTVCPASYAHEMLHTFGAPDMYYENEIIPQSYVDHLQSIGSSEIMYTVYLGHPITNAFTELDAYYVGLTNYSSERAAWGLGYTQHYLR